MDLGFEERLEEEVDLESLSEEIFAEAVAALESEYIPAMWDAIAFYKEIINAVQYKIWDCEEEEDKERLFELEQLDDALRSDLADFEKMFFERYPGGGTAVIPSIQIAESRGGYQNPPIYLNQ